MPSSSIFNFESTWPLRVELRQAGGVRLFGSFLLFAAALPLCAFYSAMSPLDFLQGRFQINATIRTAHDTALDPHPGDCEVTQDGLLYFPNSAGPAATLLLAGDSTSNWYRFPCWVDQLSAESGRRLEILSAAYEGISPHGLQDSVDYVLSHNGRRFDAVLLKPSSRILLEISFPPDEAYLHPEIGTGFSLRFSGAAAKDHTKSFLGHFEAALQRRQTDFAVRDENLRWKRRTAALSDTGSLELVTTIPPAMAWAVDRMLKEYDAILSGIAEACRAKGIPLILMTTAVRRYEPGEADTRRLVASFPPFEARYSLICIQDDLNDLLNEKVRDVADREQRPVIDSARYIENLPQKDLFVDNIHIRLDAERGHGAFIARTLRKIIHSPRFTAAGETVSVARLPGRRD